MSETEGVELEVDEDAEVYVSDLEEYLKTRKLKLINRAKERVHEIRENRLEYAEYDFQRKCYEVYHTDLAEAVATYGNELLPIAKGAVKKGTLSQSALGKPGSTQIEAASLVALETFVVLEGRIPEDGLAEAPQPPITMEYYRQLQNIERKLGLGLELKEQTGPAEL